MKKIVCVIGGSGFLGSYVVEALIKNGYIVRIFDKYVTLSIPKPHETIVGDILNLDSVTDAIRGSTYVLNFAGVSDIGYAMNNPIETANANILGNLNILEACRREKIVRYVYASTVYVYGNAGGFYRCSKQSAELFIEEYNNRFNLTYTILRYGSLYGPKATADNGLYKIIKNALVTGEVVYAGSKNALREYIHVEDAACATIQALSDDYRNSSLVLTGQEPMKICDLLEMVAEIMNIGKPVKFLEEELPGHYVRTPYAFKENIGKKYIPPVHIDLGQGIVQMIRYIKEREGL